MALFGFLKRKPAPAVKEPDQFDQLFNVAKSIAGQRDRAMEQVDQLLEIVKRYGPLVDVRNRLLDRSILLKRQYRDSIHRNQRSSEVGEAYIKGIDFAVDLLMEASFHIHR